MDGTYSALPEFAPDVAAAGHLGACARALQPYWIRLRVVHWDEGGAHYFAVEL
jgi:hypothetical protein